jgi:hypothetical protein
MSDTGAPWNLPFPLPTDLVRDGADAIKDLAEATATGLSAAGNAGIGSNVVQTVKTDVFSASIATGATSDITGLQVKITPSSSSSKVLIIASVSFGGTNANFLLKRGGSATAYVGDAVGNRTQRSVGGLASEASGFGGLTSAALMFVDLPGVATEVTYDLAIGHISASTVTMYVNRGFFDDNNVRVPRGASTLTAIEVSA